MFEALLWDNADAGRVRCRLCPHGCVIADGKMGLCGVRQNRGGKLFSLVYGRPCAMHVDPMEKKPLYHFLPGSRTFSLATVGCNLRCDNCQNWQISQMSAQPDGIVGDEVSAEAVVLEAESSGCASIAYTYTEPTVFMEYALDISKLAREKGMKNVFVSNGYMSEDAIKLIVPHLDADNVDLKSFSERFYRENCGATLEPVLAALKSLVKAGVWVEVTTLLIPSMNDSPGELMQIAAFIGGELGKHVPWHVSRFHPDYKLDKLPSTDVRKVEEAVRIGHEAGLKYVYAGNVPHGRYENTYCPGCGRLLIERHGFTVSANKMSDGACPDCAVKTEGVWN